MIYILTILCLGVFIFSFYRDRRSLLNALFLLSIVMMYLSIVSLVYERFPLFHQILLGILYGVVPLSIFLFAIFMIINGVIVLKKEGKRLANALPIFMGKRTCIF